MHDGLRDHHLRVEPRVLRDQPRERPVVVVRPVHHRRHAAGEEGENHEINRLSMSSTAIPARLHCPKTRNNSAPRSPEQRRKVPATSTRGGARRASLGATRPTPRARCGAGASAADAAGRGQRRAQGCLATAAAAAADLTAMAMRAELFLSPAYGRHLRRRCRCLFLGRVRAAAGEENVWRVVS